MRALTVIPLQAGSAEVTDMLEPQPGTRSSASAAAPTVVLDL